MVPHREQPAATGRGGFGAVATLTVVVAARDEEAMLPGCLRRLEFADEVIVAVDDRTVDGSAAVASAAGATVLAGGAAVPDARHAADLGADGFTGRTALDAVAAVDARVGGRSKRP